MINQPVNINEMDSTLSKLINQAPNFDKELVRYVDSCTTDRDGFDMYSWKYWGIKARIGDSISAVVTSTYLKYEKFRKLQD